MILIQQHILREEQSTSLIKPGKSPRGKGGGLIDGLAPEINTIWACMLKGNWVQVCIKSCMLLFGFTEMYQM